MLDTETLAFLEGGSALIVGTVAPGGEPHATRGWGLRILADDPIVARLLLPLEDTTVTAHLVPQARIAITAADVPTLRSLQLKGRAVRVEPATPEDEAWAERYIDAFFGDVTRDDGIPSETLRRMRPRGYVACTVTLDDLFVQTPGPGAGAPWAGARR